MLSWLLKNRKYFFIIIGVIIWVAIFVMIGKKWGESTTIEDGKRLGQKELCDDLQEKIAQNTNLKQKLRLGICAETQQKSSTSQNSIP